MKLKGQNDKTKHGNKHHKHNIKKVKSKDEKAPDMV